MNISWKTFWFACLIGPDHYSVNNCWVIMSRSIWRNYLEDKQNEFRSSSRISKGSPIWTLKEKSSLWRDITHVWMLFFKKKYLLGGCLSVLSLVDSEWRMDVSSASGKCWWKENPSCLRTNIKFIRKSFRQLHFLVAKRERIYMKRIQYISHKIRTYITNMLFEVNLKNK